MTDKEKLNSLRERMPEDKQGVEIEINGKKYAAFIRRLTPVETGRLQGVPDWYKWDGVSESQQYKMHGNGWQIDTITYIWQFMPKFDRPIRVWSLFDGMSCASVALKNLNIDIECFISSEIDRHAIVAEKLNFPDMIQVGSVTDINVKELVDKYGVPDLLCGGSPCFVEGTKVLTDQGYKNIEDVKVGDMVLTHNNRCRKVLNIGNKKAQTYRFHAQGFLDVICTENHPFYARKKNFKYYVKDDGKPSKRLELDAPEWVEAKKLANEYYVCNNIPQDIEENPLNITPVEAYIIGRYIADGHTRKDLRYDQHHNGSRAWQLILSIGNDKVKPFLDKIDNALNCSCYRHSDGCHRIVFSNKRLVEIVENNCGCGAHNKYFSEMLINLPKDILQEVLKGYMDGDGCKLENCYQFVTISPMLVLTAQRVIAKLYNKHINVMVHHPAQKRMLCGRMVNQSTQYLVRYSEQNLDTEKPKKIDDKIWYNAKSFTPEGIDTVYNLEVEEDNSYTVNNMVVHNCQSFSFSGKMKGMATSQGEEIYSLDRYLELKEQGFEFEGQSYLFWEYMRILTELKAYNPDILFFLENVEMLEKWERCLSHAIGVQGVHINSALVSAQQRKRIYWTNFRTKDTGVRTLFGFEDDDPFQMPFIASDIPQPEDRGIVIKDVLVDEADSKYYLKDDMVTKLLSNTDKSKLAEYVK